MSGPNPRTRAYTRERAIGVCRNCGREAPGSTTVERRRGGRAEYVYHFCGDCIAAIEERPLEFVLLEAGGDGE